MHLACLKVGLPPKARSALLLPRLANELAFEWPTSLFERLAQALAVACLAVGPSFGWSSPLAPVDVLFCLGRHRCGQCPCGSCAPGGSHAKCLINPVHVLAHVEPRCTCCIIFASCCQVQDVKDIQSDERFWYAVGHLLKPQSVLKYINVFDQIFEAAK